MNDLCEDCGACCEELEVPRGVLPWSRTFMAARGIPVSLTRVRLPCPCPHLTEGQECDIWPQRPIVCRAFTVGGPGCLEARARLRPWLDPHLKKTP